jgi:hypothetical protein
MQGYRMNLKIAILVVAGFVFQASSAVTQFVSVLGGTNGVGAGYSVFFGNPGISSVRMTDKGDESGASYSIFLGYPGIQVDVPLYFWSDMYPHTKWGLENRIVLGIKPSLKIGSFLIRGRNLYAYVGIKNTIEVLYESSQYRYKDEFIDTTEKYSGINVQNLGLGPFFELFWYKDFEQKGGIEMGTTLINLSSPAIYRFRLVGQIFINIKTLGQKSP